MSTPTWPQLVVPPQPISNPPVGAVVDWPTATPPAMWLICDGSSHPTATYPDLFGVIGYSFGGSGLNFNLPDLRDRFTLGTGPVHAALSTGGAATVTLTAAEQGPPHYHTLSVNSGGAGTDGNPADHTHGVNINSGGAGTGGGSVDHTHAVNITSGSELAQHTHSLPFNTQANLAAVAGTQVNAIGLGTPVTGSEGAVHTHAVNGNTGVESTGHAHNVGGTTAIESANHGHNVAGNTNTSTGGGAHENMPPYLSLYKIIRVERD